jgi:hypothetical protein
MKQPNPNLWDVSYESRWSPSGNDDLMILAASASSAEAKARRLLKKNGETGIRITRIRHRGTIDAF